MPNVKSKSIKHVQLTLILCRKHKQMVQLMRWWHLVQRRTEGIGNFCCSTVSRECLSCECMMKLNPTGHLSLLQLNQCPESHRLTRGCPQKEMKPHTNLREHETKMSRKGSSLITYPDGDLNVHNTCSNGPWSVCVHLLSRELHQHQHLSC